MTSALTGAEGGGGSGDYSTSAFQSCLPNAGQAISADYHAKCSKILERKHSTIPNSKEVGSVDPFLADCC